MDAGERISNWNGHSGNCNHVICAAVVRIYDLLTLVGVRY